MLEFEIQALEFEHLPWKSPRKLVTLDLNILLEKFWQFFSLNKKYLPLTFLILEKVLKKPWNSYTPN